MYFPYLRGRLNELIAIRELVNNNLITNRVLPIIEPIKFSSVLNKSVKACINNHQKVAVILNPEVGSLYKSVKNLLEDPIKNEFLGMISNDTVIKSVIMNSGPLRVGTKWGLELNKNELLVINNNRDQLDLFEKEFSDDYPKFVLIPDETAFRRRIKSHRVLLGDKFEKQNRNVDYKNVNDEFFSDDHLFYKEDGYEGFADFSVIGSSYFESGFAPYAIAIHIVYFADDNTIRIKHFVSDSNDDISNPAKKFYEAMEKLYGWWSKGKHENTYGIMKLIEHYKNETYPGLGSVKKYSIMHHLELVDKYLNTQS